MAQNPNPITNNMTPPLHQENNQSLRHPPPRPPPRATAFDQIPKRVTRDLPNLSDCHGCYVRINHTDPNDRLQTLGSVWRIVLLCKKCIKLVHSGQTCPYCLKNITAESDCTQCSSCRRHLHNGCVSRYGKSPPWSYCENERVKLESFICIDCWVPRFFRKSIGVCKKIKNSVKLVEKDANFEPKRKVVVALKSKDNKTLRKAIMAKNALELVAKKDKNKGLLRNSSLSSDDTNVTEVVNDAELAFHLHRAMNSSPRISRTLCPVKSSYVGAPCNDRGEKLKVYCRVRSTEKVVRTSSEAPPCVKVYSRTRLEEKIGHTSSEAPPCVLVYSRTRLKEKSGHTSSETRPCVKVYSRTTFKEKVGQTSSEDPLCVKVYSRTRLKEKFGQTILEAPPCITVNENGSHVDSGCSEAELKTYKRSRLKRKMCKERVGLSDLITGEHNLGDDCRDFSGLRFSHQEGSQHSLHLHEASALCPLSSGGDNTFQGEICANNSMQAESCNLQEDRFLLKYRKKKKCSEPGLYVHEDTFPHPAPDPSIPRNWSVESGTSSNVLHSS